jgi:hypothetical protein
MLQAGTSRGSIPDDVIGFFNLPTLSSALGSTQPLRKMIPGISLEVKGGQRVRLTTSPPSVSRLSRENVGASTSHNPIGLQGFTYLHSGESNTQRVQTQSYWRGERGVSYHGILMQVTVI